MKNLYKYQPTHCGRTKRPSGFTIIELLIATLVFSIVLVIVMATFIQISRIFYKGVNMSNTQDDTRTALTDIANDIQFATANVQTFTINTSTASSYFCVGNHRYAVYTGQQVGSSAGLAGIYREDETPGSCPSLGTAAVDTSKADQLLGSGMQVNYLHMDCNGTICHLNTHVIFYGGTPGGLFASASNPGSQTPWEEPDADCTGALTSSQFCATADFKRTVLQRI